MLDLDIIKHIRNFYADSKRVLEVSYKPDSVTFRRTIKIVLIGTILLGALGFVVAEIVGIIT